MVGDTLVKVDITSYFEWNVITGYSYYTDEKYSIRTKK